MSIVSTIKDKCKACYACVRNCPVKAIVVVDGQAQVSEERCISCGNCVRVCSQKAKLVLSHVEALQKALCTGKKDIYAIVAPSWMASFPFIPSGALVRALEILGFADVQPVTIGVELTVPLYKNLLKHANGTVISTYCPAIVELIQKYYPKLVKNLAQVDSAVLALAKSIKKENPHAKVCFIGPCIAKKNEALKQPYKWVDMVITFRELKEMLKERDLDIRNLTKGAHSWDTNKAQLFPVSGGLLRNLEIEPAEGYEQEICVVEEYQPVKEVLDSLNAGAKGPRLLDILFCRGCIDGPEVDSPIDLMQRKQLYLTIERIGVQAQNRTDNIDYSRQFKKDPVLVNQPTEEDIKEILKLTFKVTPEDELNCGACGYETCRAKAIAVYQGLAEVEMCLPYLLNIYRGKANYFENQVQVLASSSVKYSLTDIVGESEEIKNIKTLAKRAAETEAGILLIGEKGTGKNLLAQAIHYQSPRKTGPFITVDCSISDVMLEEELFGTDEHQSYQVINKQGRIEMAEKGTLFLDEVSDLSLNLQAKLLRLMQEKTYEPVGGHLPKAAELRIIAATTKDLKEMVTKGDFRQDLYYKLNVISIKVPALRTRKADIPKLIDSIIMRFCTEKGVKQKGIKPEVMELLLNYDWPGNVWELENVVERLLIVAEGSNICVEHLPQNIRDLDLAVQQGMVRPLRESIKELEKKQIIEALRLAKNNKLLAAQLLDIPRATLYQRLKEFQILE